MKLEINNRYGFTLVEIMIVVAIVGLLAAIAIPNFVRARNSAQQNACIGNLRQIDGAICQWALENRKGDNDTPTPDDISPYIKNNIFPHCPGNGTYILFNLGHGYGPLVICTKVVDTFPHNYQLPFDVSN